MIKTTSFAPPRPSHPSQSRARQHAIKAAKTRAAQTPTRLESLFPVPTPAPEISAAQARELMQKSAPKSKSKKTEPVLNIAPSPVPAIETVMPSTSPTQKNPPRPRKAKEPALVSVPAPVVASLVEVAPAVIADVVAEKVAAKKAAPEAKKARRPRVPTNLAEQYGQSLSRRVENGVENVSEEESPKKRLSRAERQARRDLMNPDDDLLSRLHRVHNTIPTVKAEKRPRGWRFDCGRCGQTSYFQTNGALCGCGALAIKD